MREERKEPVFSNGSNDHADLRLEQIRLLYAQAPTGVIATVVNSLVVVMILWGVVSHWKLIVWLLFIMAVSCSRFWFVRQYAKSPLKDSQAQSWANRFFIGLLVSGALMGSAGMFLFPVNSLPHQVFLAFVLGGMVAGATGTYSVMLQGFLIYSIPLITPITVRLLLKGSGIEAAMGGLLIIYYAIMVNTAYSVHRTSIRSLRLRLENRDLVKHLMISQSQAESAIETLKHEISERKNAEKALSESEQLFRMLVETMNDGLGLQDDKGLITYVNDRFCEMLGYSRDELTGRRVEDLFDESNRSKYLEQIARRKLGGRTSYQIELLKRDGRKIPAIVSASPVLDEHGEYAGTIAAITDITVLKRAEQELLESEEKYRMIFENSPLGIAHFDRDGTVTAYNENLAKMSGTSRDEFIGVNPLDYLQDEEMKAAIVACISGEHTHYEGYYRSRRTGRVTPVKADFSPIFSPDGSVAGGIGIIQDISEQKKAEKELGDQLRFLQTLIDTIPNPIFYKDTGGRYVGCNKAFESRLGLDRHQIVGRSVFEVLPRGLAEEYHRMDLALFENSGIQSYETSLNYADGTTHDVIINKATYTNLDGTLAGLVGVGVDITDRKRAEQALRKAHDELELRVKERTAELISAVRDLQNEITERKRAERALRSSSDKLKLFAYSVVHDLKSPAIGIYGVAKLLHRHYNVLLDERGRMYCEQILKASEHVAALVEQINTYMTAKDAPIEFETVNVNDILRAVREEFSAQLSLRRVDWYDLPMPLQISADRLSIHRVFRNLVDNALKYGGEQLSKIKIEYQENNDFHLFSVHDDGVGVTREDSEKIFQVFERNKSARGTAGTGLGLAIVREIAERHGGEVWVEPGAERGTVFYVSIARRDSIR